MKEQQQQHQSTINNGRIRSTQPPPPAVSQDYYGTMTNRISPGIIFNRIINYL